MDMLEIMRSRRSVRRYTEEKIPDEQLKQIVSAALLAPSGHSKYPCEYIVVKNRAVLEKMAHCRKNVAKMLEGAAAAVVVIADKDKSDTFVEDSCVAMMSMELWRLHLVSATAGFKFVTARLKTIRLAKIICAGF